MSKNIYIRDGRAPIPKNEFTSHAMSSNCGKNTRPEIILRKALWSYGMKGYRLHFKKVTGKPDIVFVSKKIAVFVNGCFWHRCPHCNLDLPKSNVEFWKNKFEKNKNRDQENIELLKSKGWTVIIIWECMIKNNIFEVLELIKNEVQKNVD